MKKLNVFVLPFLLSLLVLTVEPIVVEANVPTLVTNSSDIGPEGVYHIGSASGLEALAEVVNAGSGLSGYTFILTSDLDLNSSNWEPIGNNVIVREYEISYLGGFLMEVVTRFRTSLLIEIIKVLMVCLVEPMEQSFKTSLLRM
jgi:hypothetical protein